MNRLKQNSTIVGLLSIISSVIGFVLGTLPQDVAALAITNGIGLIAVNA